MEETISLRELFQTLKKRFWLIAIIAVFATAVSGIVSYFVLTPVYQASTQLLVNQSKSDQPVFNTNEIQTNLQLINTYNVIIKSPAILNLVKEDLDLDMSTEALNGKITVGSEQNSQVVLITVQDPDAFMAADIANTVASVFQREISNIMNVDNVSILAKSEVKENPAPIKPQPTLNMAIALVVGLMLGVGLAFLLEYLDNTIKGEQDIEKLLELPVLGAITTITDEIMVKKGNSEMSSVRGETVGS